MSKYSFKRILREIVEQCDNRLSKGSGDPDQLFALMKAANAILEDERLEQDLSPTSYKRSVVRLPGRNGTYVWCDGHLVGID